MLPLSRPESRTSRTFRKWQLQRVTTNTRLCSSLLLLRLLLDVSLLRHGRDLPQHDHTVPVHEGHTGKTLTILEGVADKRLLGSHGDLGHFVRLQTVGILHLLSTSLLAHLPLQLHDPAGRPTAAHETNGGVAALDLSGDVELGSGRRTPRTGPGFRPSCRSSHHRPEACSACRDPH